MRYLTVLLAFMLILASVSTAGDRLKGLTENLSQAACVELNFLSVIESDIFDTVDTASGNAVIAADGRYRVHVGQDEYLYDGEHLYSYSVSNNQVTVENVAPGSYITEGVAFLLHLDEFFQSHILSPGLEYRLVRLESAPTSIPDSLVLTLKSDTLRIDEIAYYDINEELNRIVMVQQQTRSECADSLFEPAFPDSVEMIRLF